METSQRNVLLLGVGLILLVLIGYYVLLLGPQREELAERQEERDAREEQLAQLDAEVAELEDIQSRAPEIERELLELSRRVPEQPEVPTVVVQVEEIADEAGVTQLLVEPGDPEQPEDGGEYTIIPVTMSFEGNYGDLQNFLSRLQDLTRLVAVENVVHEAAEEEEGEDGAEVQQDAGQGRSLQIELGTEVYAQPGEGGIQTVEPAEDTDSDTDE